MHANVILVVDDDADVRARIRHALSSQYDVVEATGGLAAVALAHRHRPALILLDLGLPGRDGWTVARLLRDDPFLQTTPILAITADLVSAALAAARQADGPQVLGKPFNLLHLEQNVGSPADIQISQTLEEALASLGPAPRSAATP